MKTLSSTSGSQSTRSKPPLLWLGLLGLGGLGLGASLLAPRSSPPASTPQVAVAPAKPEEVRRLKWRVTRAIPHDRSAFLQGLLWDSGGFYESTGIEGQSSLRRVAYPSGQVEKKRALPRDVFGEGLVAWKDRLIQITWQSNRAFVWDKETFEPRGEFSYPGEGWGITSDGSQLIMSDGSSTLFFRDPEGFKVKRTLPVTLGDVPVKNLNELEFIDGLVWANVWQTDSIVCIDPQSGKVRATLDLKGILPASQRNGREDVLNGIAHDPKTGRTWVSGKLWPKIFEIEVD